ncbi:MAG: transposase [Acidobacteriota bacterium]
MIIFSDAVHGVRINMSIRVYSEINLHVTWHTKNDTPLITAPMQPDLYAFLKNKIVTTRGAYFHAIGGTETHVHIAFSIKPSIHLDEWIGQLKGASSFEMGKDLQWQAGYGIVSFGSRDLKWVVGYIHNQREHHSKGTIHERLERCEGSEDEVCRGQRKPTS